MKQKNIKSIKAVVKGSDAHMVAACAACDKVTNNGFAFVSESLEPAFIDCCEASNVPVLSMDAAESAAGEVIVLYLNADLTATESEETEAAACAQMFANFGNVTVTEKIRTAFETQLQKCGYTYQVVDAGVTEYGVVYCYATTDGEPLKDETDEAADEVEVTETAEETTEQTDERKPSALSALIAKVSGKAKAAAEAAKKVARKVSFLLAVVVVLALAFLTFGGSIIYVLNPIAEALDPAGWLRVILGIAFVFTFAIDAAVFVEINCIALISRLFPFMFEGCDKPDFILPRNMIYWTIKENLK